mmetsp:Transcript_65436/g.189599  ORF Transcript_65436/g.189599 Transcript_65436/m.189599 type:complete len:216 (-) Transcript_65436:842-1489(-)
MKLASDASSHRAKRRCRQQRMRRLYRPSRFYHRQVRAPQPRIGVTLLPQLRRHGNDPLGLLHRVRNLGDSPVPSLEQSWIFSSVGGQYARHGLHRCVQLFVFAFRRQDTGGHQFFRDCFRDAAGRRGNRGGLILLNLPNELSGLPRLRSWAAVLFVMFRVVVHRLAGLALVLRVLQLSFLKELGNNLRRSLRLLHGLLHLVRPRLSMALAAFSPF